jgi:cell cycle arrest protein BUB3
MKLIQFSNDFEIINNPTDTISSLKFSPISNLLLASSWDSHIYLYNIFPTSESNNLCANFCIKQIFSHPQLDCCFEANKDEYVYSVGLDKDLKRINLELVSISIVGEGGESELSKVVYDNNLNCVYTICWDESFKKFDSREKNMMTSYPSSLNLYEMVISGNQLVLAGVDSQNIHKIKIYDVRKLNEPLKYYNSPLKYQASSICNTNKFDGFVMGSIEGKICVEYFSNEEDNLSNDNYIFKCHREKNLDNIVIVDSVNAVIFHPKLNVFFSGGSDKIINAWDNSKKKKVYKSQSYPQSIVGLSINHEGNVMAIASSENYEDVDFSKIESEKEHKIFLKNIEFI